MIVVDLIGGLGNQMFQYAAAKALAVEKKQKLFVNTDAFKTYKLHQYGLHHFNISANIFEKPNKYVNFLRRQLYASAQYREVEFSYNEAFFSLNAADIFLTGYFQSEKYFSRIASQIRKDFEICSPLKKNTKDLLLKMQAINSVSIHIRRGDYIGNPVHETDNGAYYQKAIKTIQSAVEQPVFFVFSDDMAWVKENLFIENETVFVDFNDALSNFEDLKLMSACKHHIIANSSFSWWGAWLDPNPEKIVTAPEKWFNGSSFNSIDVIPNSWIKL